MSDIFIWFFRKWVGGISMSEKIIRKLLLATIGLLAIIGNQSSAKNCEVRSVNTVSDSEKECLDYDGEVLRDCKLRI